LKKVNSMEPMLVISHVPSTGDGGNGDPDKADEVEKENAALELVAFANSKVREMDSQTFIVDAQWKQRNYSNVCGFLAWVLEDSQKRGSSFMATAIRVAGAFDALALFTDSKPFLVWKKVFRGISNPVNGMTIHSEALPGGINEKSRENFDYLVLCVPEEWQVILNLHYQYGHSFSRIGELLELEEGKVSKAHDAAVKKINATHAVDFTSRFKNGESHE